MIILNFSQIWAIILPEIFDILRIGVSPDALDMSAIMWYNL